MLENLKILEEFIISSNQKHLTTSLTTIFIFSVPLQSFQKSNGNLCCLTPQLPHNKTVSLRSR